MKHDSILQRLIYSLVPDLLKSELEKRINYCENTDDEESKELLFDNKTLVNLKLYNDQINLLYNSKSNSNVVYVKYIQCCAATPIRILTKLIRNKHNIPHNYMVTKLQNKSE